MVNKSYQCPECKLHYENEQVAKQCEAYCKEHQSCNMDITRLSEERKSVNQNITSG